MSVDLKKVSWDSDDCRRSKSQLFPKIIRCIISGSSGSGKTYAALNMILQELIDYDHLIIASPSLIQPEYQILVKCLEKGLPCDEILNIFNNENKIKGSGYDADTVIDGIAKELRTKPSGNIETYTDPNDVPDPADLSPYTLVLFDDTMLDPARAELFFTRGRPLKISTIFITQSYYQIPRRTIRENSNVIIFFKQNQKSLDHIY